MGRTSNTRVRDFKTDASLKEVNEQAKKEFDERSEFSDEMASLYEKYSNLIMEMLKFDRKYLNVENMNRIIGNDESKYGPFIKPKGKCLTSSTVCSEHFRIFKVKGKGKGGETLMELKVIFTNYIDKNGNPSARMKNLVKGIYALQAEKVVIELSKIMEFCRFFLETMRDMIDRFYGRNSSQYKFYQKCYAKTDRLNSKYRKLVKDFSKRAHTDTAKRFNDTIKDKGKVEFFNNNDSDITSTSDRHVAGWEVKRQEIKEMIKNFNNIVKANTYTNSVNRSMQELNKLSKKVTAKYGNRFSAIIKKAKNEEEARKFINGFEGKGSTSFYRKCLDKVNENFKILKERSQVIFDQQDELKRYILNKEQLNDEAKLLEGKSNEEKLKFYTDRLSAMKECLRNLNEIHRQCNRAVENVNNALIEMNNLTNTKEWKDWIKNEVKPMLRGLGRMFKLKREIRNKDNETKREAKREAAAEKAAAEKAAAEKAAAEQAAAEQAEAEQTATEKAAKEEEKKRTAATSSPSDEPVPVWESPDPSADSLEGSAPLEEPLPVR